MAYVYGHYTADTNELFYIGKGTGKRAWSNKKRNKHWQSVVNKHGYTVQIFYDNLNDADAYRKEHELILEVGVVTLTNILEGGNGFTSVDAKRLADDPNWKRKHLEGIKKMRKSPEYWENFLNATTRNPVWRKRISSGLKNVDPEVHKRQSASLKKTLSNPDIKEKWSESRKAMWQDPEYRKKRAAISERISKDSEINRKRSESMKRYRATLKKTTESPLDIQEN